MSTASHHRLPKMPPTRCKTHINAELLMVCFGFAAFISDVFLVQDVVFFVYGKFLFFFAAVMKVK
jgi:hypothetical protein